jgi:hypothetical protein
LLLLTLVALLQQPPPFPAQSAAIVITGKVLSGSPALPVPGALIRAGNLASPTDADGRFVLSLGEALPSVRLIVSAPGFFDQTLDVAVVAGRGSVEILLGPRARYSEDVVVSGTRDTAAARPPGLPLEPAAILGVAGAVDNVFRVLQTLPGVAATDDFGSRLSVRGGGPDQNLTVMDGVEIHNPYRLFGLTSAFNPETVERFELTAGGFAARYGDRLSSILTVDNRAGTAARSFAGSASISVTDANIVTEGRLPGGSWLVTGRRTYYDLFAERLTDSDLPSFGDLQSKLAFTPRPGQQLTVFALRSRESTNAEFEGNVPADRLGLRNTSSNDVASLSFASPVGRRATTRTVAAYYRYSDALDVDGSVENQSTRANAPDAAFGRASIVFTRSLVVRDLSLRQEINLAASRTQTVSAGLEVHALRTTWGWTIGGDRNDTEANGSSIIGGSGLPDLLDSRANTTRGAAWLEDDLGLWTRVRLAGGARVDWNGLTGETLVSPRVRATVELTPITTLRVSAGRYTQSPGYEKLLQSDYFVDLSNIRALNLRSERSAHYIAGLERPIGGRLRARIEAYYKTFDRLIVGRLETPAETEGRVARYDFPAPLAFSIPSSSQITTVPGNGATGRAYGADVFLEKRPQSSRDLVSGWISYTWGSAAIRSYGRRYPFDYDRPHALSLVSSWRVTPRVSLATTFRAASGFPDTRPTGLRVASNLKSGAIEGSARSLEPRVDPESGLYVWGVDLGGVENINTTRLPLYARLDVRATYQRSRSSRWLFYVEVINALGRDNAGQLTPELRYDPGSDRPTLVLVPEGGLPRLPSFGIRVSF